MTPPRPTLPAAILLAMVAATSVAAQTVEVRSGDHEGYARLVFEFPGTPADWALWRDGTNYVLSLAAPDVRFDTTDVFRLIGRDRIADVVQGEVGGPLTVTLACVCHADAFEFRGRSLVVDIIDGPAPEGWPFENGARSEGTEDAAAVEDVPEALADAPVPIPVAPFGAAPGGRPGTGDPPGPQGALPEPDARRDFEVPLMPPSDGSPFPPDEFRDALSEAVRPRAARNVEDGDPVVEAIARQLARASAQGLVELPPEDLIPPPRPEVASVSAPPTPPTTSGNETRADPASSTDLHGETPGDRANLRILTGVDRDFAALGLDRPVADGNPLCLPDHLVDVGAWGDESLIGAEIGRYRGQILDASDRPDPAAITALARHYLFLTFGTETRALVSAFPGLVAEPDVLSTLADIMDDGFLTADHPLEGQSGCTSPVALWAFLAAADPATAVPATATILNTFSGLPVHIRRHLAPRLAAAFRAAGDDDAARSALAAVTRAPGPHGDAVAFAEAALAAGDPDMVDASSLEAQLAFDTPQAAEAAALRLEWLIARGGPIPEKAISDAAAFAFEFRGAPLGDRLRVAEMRALSSNGASRVALAAYQILEAEASTEFDPDGRLATELLGDATAMGSDLDLIALGSALGPRIPSGTGAQDARIGAAARLIDLGFEGIAAGILRPGDEEEPTIRISRARRALTLGDAVAALSWLEGGTTPMARLLTAEALSAAGRHAEAADIFAQIGDTERSAAEALRAGALTSPATASGTAGDGAPQVGTQPSGLGATSPVDLLVEAERLRQSLGASLDEADGIDSGG